MDQNPSKSQAMISGKDRISELPDAIICEILSNLPTKDAVATTILSKRWKDQWTTCFNLDFRSNRFLRFNPRLDEYDDPTKVHYVNVKDVIALNKSPYIKKFRLESETMDPSDITACLDSIVRRNVEEIELDVSKSRRNVEEIELDVSLDGEYVVMLPQSLFTCETLVFLEISENALCGVDMPPSIHLPRLKVFHANLLYPSDAITTKLFCDLPVLEELSFSIWSLDKGTLNIFVPSLKRLKLELKEAYGYQIVVRAPSLKELDISDDFMSKYVFEELPLDVKARLKFGMCFSWLDDEAAAHAIQLINGISVIKSLALSSCIIQDFGNVVFPNVTCLELDDPCRYCFTYLPNLIDRLPNLMFLVLKMVTADLQHVRQCSLLCLKRIEVKLFRGQEYELKWFENLLKFAQVLDEVVIHTHKMTLEERKNLCLKLSSFPRGLKNCQFNILEDT